MSRWDGPFTTGSIDRPTKTDRPPPLPPAAEEATQRPPPHVRAKRGDLQPGSGEHRLGGCSRAHRERAPYSADSVSIVNYHSD